MGGEGMERAYSTTKEIGMADDFLTGRKGGLG
jgi:hypothetical protein